MFYRIRLVIRMKRAFTIIESIFMIVTIFVFTLLCLGIMHKKGWWPFHPRPEKVAVGH